MSTTLRFVAEFEVPNDHLSEDDMRYLRNALSMHVADVAVKGSVRSAVQPISRASIAPPNTKRANIHIGDEVDVVLKADQPTGKLTHGVVTRILTKSAEHHRGIKVMLADGKVGRVQRIGE